MSGGAVYVSSKLKHRGKWLGSGIPTVSSWIQGEEPLADGYSDMWDRYRDEVSRCGGIILYAEAEDQLKGAMIEVGLAFAARVPIAIVWTGTVEALASKIGTIVYHESVTVVGTLEDAAVLFPPDAA